VETHRHTFGLAPLLAAIGEPVISILVGKAICSIP
jgi:hypothetical protein